MRNNTKIAFTLMLMLTGCDLRYEPESPPSPPPGAGGGRESISAADTPPAGDSAAEPLPAELTAKVSKIVEGDRIEVQSDAGETIRVRLHGIEAPEPDQPYGDNARETLTATIAGQTVRIVSHGNDEHGWTIGDIYHEGTRGNLALVQGGLGWHDGEQAADDTALMEAQQRAEEINTGLWSSSHGAIPPWEWRGMSDAERDEYR